MLLKRFFIIQFIFFSVLTFKAQELNPVPEKVFFEQEKEKPIILYLYTDWCAICRIQKRVLDHAPDLVKNLSNKAEFMSINAESHKNSIALLGKTFEFVSNGTSGMHEIAYEFSGGQPVYPMWVFIDAKSGKWIKHEGLLKKEELEAVIETTTS